MEFRSVIPLPCPRARRRARDQAHFPPLLQMRAFTFSTGAWSAPPQWACWSGLPAPLRLLQPLMAVRCGVHTSSLSNLTTTGGWQRKELVQAILQFCARLPVSGLALPFLSCWQSWDFIKALIKSIQDEWLLKAAKFWSSLAARSPHDIYKRMALDSCASAVARNRRIWARSMSRAICDTV